MLNIDNKISPGVTRVNPSVNVHLRNTNKQHLILAKFNSNSVLIIGKQTAKFQLNLPKQTIGT